MTAITSDVNPHDPLFALTTVTTCPLCKSGKREFQFNGKEHEYKNTTEISFSFYQCLNCKLIYMDPRPAESELKTIYPPDYYSFSEENRSPEIDLSTFVGRLKYKRMVNRLLQGIRGRIDVNADTSILDIGCGGGRSLRSFQHAFGCQTTGIDFDLPDPLIQKYNSPPLVLISGNFLTHDFKGQTFDIVNSSHVIEHYADPVDFLSKCYQLTKPGGLCVIDTPNANCAPFRLFRQHWGGNHIPRHWLLLDEKNIAQAAEAATHGGFEILKIRYDLNGGLWIWSMHSLFMRGLGMERLADLLFPSDKGMFTGKAVNLSRWFIATVIDLVFKMATGTTGSMSIVFRRSF